MTASARKGFGQSAPSSLWSSGASENCECGRPALFRGRGKDVVLIILLALMLNGMIAAIIAVGRPEYLSDYRLNSDPDARHYVLLGRTIWTVGKYSREPGPPYRPDPVVAPVYPVVAGALEVFAGGVWAVYLFQTLCHAGTAVATYLLAVGFTGRRVAALAGLLVAGDAMLAVMNFEAMTEPLFMLLATVGVMLWIRELALLGARPPRFGMAVLTGLVLGLATLTRSTSAYLPILMFAAQVGLGVIQRRWRLLGHAATLLVVFYMVTNAWTLFRSSCLTDSPAGSAHIVYVYSAGAGAYQVEFGISREEAQDRIRREFNLLSFEEVSNPWIIDPEDAKTRRHPREVVREVLSRFPRSLLISSLLGIAKASISHNVHTLAYMSGHQWTSVGLDRIRRGQFSEAWRQLAQNPPLLVVLFLWEIGFVAVVCVFGLVGTIWGLLLARWRVVAICLLLVVAYYNATIAAVGIDAFYKYRTMIVPFWCLAASIGACEMGSVIMRRVRGKRETDV